jgi:hypothetical protein
MYKFYFSTFNKNSLFIRLNDMWIFTCAGSIINKWTVISATHCFKDDQGQPIETKNLAFVVGQGLLYRWTEHSAGVFCWTMIFYNLKKSHQNLSNEESNFSLRRLEVGH